MALIERNKYIRISYLNENGTQKEEDLSSLFSRIVLHEFEHLDGKNFQDKALQKVSIAHLQEEVFSKNWHEEQYEKDLLL